MIDLKSNYDRCVLGIVGLLAVALSYFLAANARELRSSAVPPPSAEKREPFTEDPAVQMLKSDRAAQARGKKWKESDASPFVSRVYLLKDDRLVDILESGKDLFPGISNTWVVENGLDYMDGRLPERDPDSDGFTNLEEFMAKTNPRDAASKPADWTKLRLVEVKPQTLEFMLETLVYAPADLTGFKESGDRAEAELVASGQYDNPPDDETGKPRANPPGFTGKTLQLQIAPGVFAPAKVTKQIDKSGRTFELRAKLDLKRSEFPQAFEMLSRQGGSAAGLKVAVGAWINSQNTDSPGKLKGQSAKFFIGQLLYVNEFVPGRSLPRATPTSMRLLSVSAEEEAAPELGPGGKRETPVAVLGNGLKDSQPISLRKNLSQTSPFSLVSIQDTRPGGALIEVRTGETFSLGKDETYNLIDVSDEEAIIDDPVRKEQHKIPRASPISPEATPTEPESSTQ